jgi:YesN/AraC family two-component response regulator
VLELDYVTKPIGLAELTRVLDQHGLIDETAKTILIVDDDPNTVEMHARLIQSHGTTSRVLKARTGREALSILEHDHADLILLDLMMPELDGFGVLTALREREATRDIPVIVVTGQALIESDMARLNRGVATVLSKGLFSVEETLAHIEAALERKRKLGLEAQRLVRQAMAFMHEHYAEPISREDMARHVGLSDDYLTTCFRKELGMTPVAYLTRYRINHARQLLSDTNQPITEIALAVGFSDSGYFSRVFRREVGVSPEAYRRGS